MTYGKKTLGSIGLNLPAPYIPLHGKGCIRACALVDHQDYEWVMQWRWFLNNYGYAVRVVKRRGACKSILMHREILKRAGKEITGPQVDHINGSKLDNRNCNIRTCTASQNGCNMPAVSNSASGYRGVTWDKSRGKWKVGIKLNGRHVLQKRSDSLEEALKIRSEAAKKFHGEFANVIR
jgi:hypothetical protein